MTETLETLETLVPQYATNKNELDSYKKICDRENAKIKELMLLEDKKEVISGGYKATYSTSTRETMNEDKLHNLLVGYRDALPSDLFKTKEYVDMETLEKYIYSGELPVDILDKIDKCIDRKEIVTLRVSRVKGGKDE